MEQGSGRIEVPLPQGLQGGLPVAAAGRGIGHADQRIGHPLHRRYHHDLPGFIGIEHQAGDMADAAGVGQRTAAELVRAGAQGDRGQGFFFEQRRVHATSVGRPRASSGEGVQRTVRPLSRCGAVGGFVIQAGPTAPPRG